MVEPNRGGPPRPSWIARIALRRLLPEHERRALLSELAELYERRRAREGDARANRWYARQLRAYPLRLLGDRVHRLLRGGS